MWGADGVVGYKISDAVPHLTALNTIYAKTGTADYAVGARGGGYANTQDVLVLSLQAGTAQIWAYQVYSNSFTVNR